MKRNPYLLVGLLSFLTLPSCVSSIPENKVEDSLYPIEFGTSVSRSVITSPNDMKEFSVWGGYDKTLNLFDKTTITNMGETWGYDGGAYYWLENKTYNFYAFHPTSVTPSLDAETGVFTLPVYSLDHTESAESVKDLMVAITPDLTAEKDGTSPIHLSFRHLLTQIDFVVKADPETLIEMEKVTITSAKLYGTHMKASYSSEGFDFTVPQKYGLWTALGDPTTIDSPSVSIENVVELDTEGKSLFKRSLLVFPLLEQEKAKLDFTYTVGTEGKEYSLSYDLSMITPTGGWQAGKVYRYGITIVDTEHILFEPPTVRPWTEGTGGIIIVE